MLWSTSGRSHLAPPPLRRRRSGPRQLRPSSFPVTLTCVTPPPRPAPAKSLLYALAQPHAPCGTVFGRGHRGGLTVRASQPLLLPREGQSVQLLLVRSLFCQSIALPLPATAVTE
jgi:hypothetical protein